MGWIATWENFREATESRAEEELCVDNWVMVVSCNKPRHWIKLCPKWLAKLANHGVKCVSQIVVSGKLDDEHRHLLTNVRKVWVDSIVGQVIKNGWVSRKLICFSRCLVSYRSLHCFWLVSDWWTRIVLGMDIVGTTHCARPQFGPGWPREWNFLQYSQGSPNTKTNFPFLNDPYTLSISQSTYFSVPASDDPHPPNMFIKH